MKYPVENGIAMRFGRVITDALKAERVKFVFAFPGGKSMDLFDALYDAPEIKLIQVRHPASAAFMAYAHAKLLGQPGICHATVGPGVHNLVPGLAEAWSGCLPVIAICPSVDLSHEGEGLFQESPLQVPLFSSFTKWSARVTMPERIRWFLRRGFQIACTGKPGPVFIEFPANFNDSDVEVSPYVSSIRPIRSEGDRRDIERVIELLLSSERPVILAGGGIFISQAFNELRQFAEALSIPVFTSCSGKGAINEDHPLYAGMVGLYRTKVAKRFWENADLVISVGSRFEEAESSAWEWLPKNPRLAQIDVDACEIGRNWTPEAAIVGDAKLVLGQLRDVALKKLHKQTVATTAWVEELQKAMKEYQEEMKSQYEDHSVPLKPLVVIRKIRRVFPENTILCHEHGLLDNWAYPHFPVLRAGACLTGAGHTCMGLGVVGAISAKLSIPERDVICVTGDGAFQMYAKEMATAVQYHAPVTYCVLNSFSLGWMRFDQELAYGDRHIGVDFNTQPEFVKLAEAYGCLGETVDRAVHVEGALERALQANRNGRTAVIDFRVDPQSVTEGFHEYYTRR